MDKQFDELSKSLAVGIGRREALRKFGVGLAGVLLAAIGMGEASKAVAQTVSCTSNTNCSNLGMVQPACCHGICVDLQSSKYNCSACGKKCPGNQTCYQGVCLKVTP